MKYLSFIKKYYGIVLLLIVLGIIVIGTIKQYYRQKEIALYRQKTIGQVIDLEHDTKANYSLEYSYVVDDVKYNGIVGVEFFKCSDGTKGCVGKKFYVYYSSKNPEYSRIYLGKYEKHKTTVEFFK